MSYNDFANKYELQILQKISKVNINIVLFGKY